MLGLLWNHLLKRLKNEQAARHLLDGIENVYERLEENPLQFPLSRDAYLAGKGYHEAIAPQMDYTIVSIFSLNYGKRNLNLKTLSPLGMDVQGHI